MSMGKATAIVSFLPFSSRAKMFIEINKVKKLGVEYYQKYQGNALNAMFADGVFDPYVLKTMKLENYFRYAQVKKAYRNAVKQEGHSMQLLNETLEDKLPPEQYVQLMTQLRAMRELLSDVKM